MLPSPPTPPPIPTRHLEQASLSYSQESLWFLQQLDPENIVYNSTFTLNSPAGSSRPRSSRRSMR